ncbi:MAG TPA: TIGR03000 domain-containing protein [Pirellulales bacterium]|nr:TIGR03000 domain-containing protein [Pirellulales bacterium]
MRKIVTVAAAVCLLSLGLGATPAQAQLRDGEGRGRLGMGRLRIGRAGYYGGFRGNGYRNVGYGSVNAGYPSYGGGYYGDQSAGPLVYGDNGGGDTRQSFYSPAGASNRATIRVTVPSPNAKVYFDDSSTTEAGTDRLFTSPALDPSKSYSYTVRATWTEDGQEVTRSKDVKVQAGRAAAVDFRTP